MKSVCFIECWRQRIPLLLNRWPNVVPMAVWGCQDFEDNRGRLDFLAKLPTDQRGLRFDWYADPSVPRGPEIVAAVRKERQRVGLKAKFAFSFVDQERPDLDPVVFASDMAALGPIAQAYCCWNKCAGGEAWWGPYAGAYGISCPQTYEMSTDESLRRLAGTVDACVGTGIAVSLPPCYDATGNKRENTPTMLAFLRQIVADSHARGVRLFCASDYMIAQGVDAYYDIISTTLADCDRRST